MPFTKFLWIIVLVFFSYGIKAQTSGFIIKGRITEANGEPIANANVTIDSLKVGVVSDINGYYVLNNIASGKHRVRVGYTGYEQVDRWITVDKNKSSIDFILKNDVRTLNEVEVHAKNQAQVVKESGYNVNVIETQSVQDREVTINQLASYTAGIRVRESGGLGSNANYSLDGMSGRSVRFFIDGIPLDRYGPAYSINNLPVNLVERVEIFKGVVPPQFGGDALGGIVNVVTKNKKRKYLDASYSIGSFNTHRVALSSRWVSDSSNFYVDVQAYHNYSDNNYQVWGSGVEIADPSTGRAIQIKARRFHDAYRSTSGKLGFGFFDKKWADQFNINMIVAGNFQELQTGTTMAAVYGEATRENMSYAPSVFYSKKKIFGINLDVSAYSSVSYQKGTVIDTSSRIYDWTGKVVNEHPNNSELGRGSNGKSQLTLKPINWFQQANLTYTFNQKHKIYANYTFDLTTRTGSDPFISDRTASFIMPQRLQKQVSSLVYELTNGSNFSHSVWVKNYDFSVSTVGERYITDSLGYRPVAYSIKSSSNNWGYGYASKYNINNNSIVKFSIEKTYRLPDAEEVLGDGVFVRTSPNLQPEESININSGLLLNNIELGLKSKLNVELSVFYRNVDNQILYLLQGTLGAGRYTNVSKVKSYGVSLDARYFYNDRFKIGGNITYQQPRDWNEYVNGSRNLTYKDLLPNTPYFMANADCSYTLKNLFQNNTALVFFWNTQYVHKFFLQWPSLGNQNKAQIPTQFVHSPGISYSVKSGKYNITVGSQNIFNEQVYDNYLLQKPGRSIYVKARILIQ